MRLLPAGVLLTALCPSAGATTPWGEDPTRPTEDECAVRIDEELADSPAEELPDGCSGSTSAETGVDELGCWYLRTLDQEDCYPPGENRFGRVATYDARFEASHANGLSTITLGESGIALAVAEPGLVDIELAFPITELLWRAWELGADVSRDLPSMGTFRLGEDVGDKVVDADEADADADASFDSLEVHGFYFVLGDLDVAGRAEIDGLLVVTGTFTAKELVVASADLGEGKLGGGFVAANPVVAEQVEGDDCLIYTRDLVTGRGGGIVVTGDVTLQDCHVDAGPGLQAGGDVTITGGALATGAIAGGAVQLLAAAVTRITEVVADSLAITSSTVSGGGALQLTVAGDTTVVGSTVEADGIGLVGASLVLDAASGLVARHRDDNSEVLPIDAEESDATGLYGEQVWGASFGGYGGTEGWTNGNAFRPSEPPSGDPRDPSGHGVDGWALSWADTTYGGGGGNGIDLRLTGAVTLDGTLDANGGPAPVGPLGGGGSGGSGGVIRVEGATVSGSAVLRANGGDGALQAEGNSVGLAGGGGSGGRIAVLAGAFDGLDFTYEAVGGLGAVLDGWPEGQEEPVAWSDWRVHGGPGTVYLKAEGLPGTFLIDGNGLAPADWGCDATGPRCRGTGRLPEDLAGDDVVIRDATVQVGDLVARSLTLENADLVPDDPRVRLPWPLPELLVDGGLSTSQLYLPAWVYADELGERHTFTFDGDLVVDGGSRVAMAGYGGYSRTTPADEEDRKCWNGGSHGGRGGVGVPGTQRDTDPEEPYDDPAAPTEPGRGGCADLGWTGEEQPWCGLGGVGGAALAVAAGGEVRVDGRIEVQGFGGIAETSTMYCIATLGTAGGAGGAVWIVADALTGGGALDASGGDGASNLDGGWCGGGGGGGRVAITAALGDWEGGADVSGGEAGCGEVATAGAEGSVVLDDASAEDPGDTADDADEPRRDAEGAEGCGCATGAGPTSWVLLLAAVLATRPARRGA